MGEPYKQEGAIGEIKATLKFFQDAETRRDARDERIAEAMEKVAAQAETLKSQAETLARHEKAFVELSALVRGLQSAVPAATVPGDPEKKGLVIRILESKFGGFLLLLVAIGFAIDCITNYELVRKILAVIKI